MRHAPFAAALLALSIGACDNSNAPSAPRVRRQVVQEGLNLSFGHDECAFRVQRVWAIVTNNVGPVTYQWETPTWGGDGRFYYDAPTNRETVDLEWTYGTTGGSKAWVTVYVTVADSQGNSIGHAPFTMHCST